jgi:hypothetical protein
MRRRAALFFADTRAVTLVETALILAFLLPMLVVGFEIQRYVRQDHQIASAAEGFAIVLSHRARPIGGSALLQDAEIVAATFPELEKTHGSLWREFIGIQATYLRFEPDSDGCISGDTCNYTSARVLWTWSGGTAGSRELLEGRGLLRSCAILQPALTPSAGTLPEGGFGSGTLVAVDLVYAYRPAVMASLFASRRILRQAFLPPLYGDLEFDPSADIGEVSPCP